MSSSMVETRIAQFLQIAVIQNRDPLHKSNLKLSYVYLSLEFRWENQKTVSSIELVP